MRPTMKKKQAIINCQSSPVLCRSDGLESTGEEWSKSKSTHKSWLQLLFAAHSQVPPLAMSKSREAMRPRARPSLGMGLSGGSKIAKTHGIALLRVTLFLSCMLLVLCLHTEQLLAKGQLVTDCKSTPSLRNGNAQFLVNEVRKFVDNCIKTKDGIRFRKRLLAPVGQFSQWPTIATVAAKVDQDEEDLSVPDYTSSSSDEIESTIPETSTPRIYAKKSKFPFYRVGPPANANSRLLVNEKYIGAHRPPLPPPALILAAYLKDLPPHRANRHESSGRQWNSAIPN